MATKHRNLDGYGAKPIEWDRVQRTMAIQLPQAPGTGGPSRHTAWLTTITRSPKRISEALFWIS